MTTVNSQWCHHITTKWLYEERNSFHNPLLLILLRQGPVVIRTWKNSISKPALRCLFTVSLSHDDVIKWKHFPCYWPFVRGIHRSPVNSPHKGQWRGALMFSLICVWINGWVNNREAGDLRRYRGHYDVIVMRVWEQYGATCWSTCTVWGSHNIINGMIARIVLHGYAALWFYDELILFTALALLVLKPKYSAIYRVMPCLLMPLHQQPWCWLCAMWISCSLLGVTSSHLMRNANIFPSFLKTYRRPKVTSAMRTTPFGYYQRKPL